MLELKNISFNRDGKKILDNINLKLDENKFYCLTGPNGSGKSTLAKVIMGLIVPDSGQVILNGEDITNKTIDERAKMGIGFAFQQPVCFKGLTVYEILKIAAGKTIDKKTACMTLGKVGLCANEYLDREVNKSLSGGELKRIEISTIMVRNPYVAIFDEPEAGIDLWSFQNLTEVFKEIHKNSKGTTLVISHQERILSIADTIILLEDGRVKEVGDRDKLLNAILTKTCAMGVGSCE